MLQFKTMRERFWNRAQREELLCWESNKAKIDSAPYLAEKRAYWKTVLALIGLSVAEIERRRVLEVGCGPSGLSILFPKGSARPDYTILDPLLDRYREHFPDLFGTCREINGSLEDWRCSPGERFDLIFAINVIDHCRDIDRFLGQLRSLAAPNSARIVIGVNVHQYRWSRWLWRTFRLLIEPQHPYHFTRDEYRELFEKHLQVESIVDIEETVCSLLRKTSSEEKKPMPLLRRLLRPFKPANMLFSFLRLRGYPLHDLSGKGRSVFRHYLYIAAPRGMGHDA